MCGSGQFILALFCEFASLRVFDNRRGNKKKIFLANFAKKKKMIRGSQRVKIVSPGRAKCSGLPADRI